MSNYNRLARIDGIDLDTGIFSMTLATEGEASDGHILSIKGGQVPPKMPMLNSHFNSPTEALGSITDPVKLLEESPPRLRAIGHIEMSGEGSPAAIRRDLAHMIDKGHVTGMSIRWNEVPEKMIRRINLPSDHPYYVDEKTAQGPERWGFFFEEWEALEGSVVAVGSDSGALIGRAEETEGDVQHFWRCMAADAVEAIDGDQPSPVGAAVALSQIRVVARDAMAAGATRADLLNAVLDDVDPEHVWIHDGDCISRDEFQHTLERLEALETALEDRAESEVSPPSPQQERVEADPLPAISSPKDLFAELRRRIREERKDHLQSMRAEFARVRGRVM